MENERFLMIHTKFNDNEGYWYEMDYEYNEQGVLVKEVKRESTGEVTTKSARYDGDKLLELLTESDGSWEKIDYSYNEANILINERMDNSKGEWYEKSWEDSDNCTIEKSGYSDGYSRTVSSTSYPDERKEVELVEDNSGSYKESTGYFNEYNVLVKLESRNRDGEIIAFEEYSFDNAGNPVYQKIIDDGECSEHFYSYDEEGNILSGRNVAADGTVSTTLWEYEEGNCLRETRSSPYDKEIISYSYNSEGLEISACTESWSDYEEKGLEQGDYSKIVVVHNYDSKGRMVKTVRTTSEGESTTEEMSYDEEGNLVGFRSVEADGAVYNYIYTYIEKEVPGN